MHIVDTHAHLYLKDFDHDFDDVLANFQGKGVKTVYLPAIEKRHQKHLERLTHQYPSTFRAMTGLHPCSVSKETMDDELNFVSENLSRNASFYAAIGEIGVDLYREKDKQSLQEKAFEAQMDMATQHQLPIAIHCRAAFDETFECILRCSYKNGGIFHCFSGTEDQARRAIDLGFLIGISGIVTYKNARMEFLKNIPLKHIVVETDAPYLAPVPKRGRRNETGFIRYIVEKLADIYGVSPEEIAQQTTRNAEQLFNAS